MQAPLSYLLVTDQQAFTKPEYISTILQKYEIKVTSQ